MSFFLSLLGFLNLLLVIGAAIRILLRENLSSSARLAWFIVIVTLPGIGPIIYALFGEVRLKRHMHDRHQRIFEDMRRTRTAAMGSLDALDAIAERAHPAVLYSASINGFAPVPGNRVALMPDAATTLERIVADIDAARHNVDVLYYIWLTDHTGTRIAEALIRAAERGVRCRAAADNLGSRHLVRAPLWRRMKQAGVDARIAMPFESFLGIPMINRFDLRNHRKLTIIDGETAFLGSQNCADPEFAPKRKFGPWIDIMTRVQGPLVNQAQLLFASDWMLISDDTLDDFPLRAQPRPGGFVAQMRGTGPLERPGAASQMFCTLFEQAAREIILSTPYFVPDVAVLNALTSAALRGVRVVLIVPRRNDSWVVRAASVGFYHGLLKAGVEIHEHGPGLLHAKTLTIDGETAFFGSSNLDLRSFDLNFENDVLLNCRQTTALFRERQMLYLSHSRPVDIQAIRRLPARKRLFNNIVATMGPVL